MKTATQKKCRLKLRSLARNNFQPIELLSFLIITSLILLTSCSKHEAQNDLASKSASPSFPLVNEAPEFMIGQFIDDYDIEYTIDASTWLMDPTTKFNIIQWNKAEQYLLAQNHQDNSSDAGLFVRIDFLNFEGAQKPYEWGFCISAYNANSLAEAKQTIIADRSKPKTGCDGHPFSRMRPLVNKTTSNE